MLSLLQVSMENCILFDKEYCKLKSQCLKKRPSTDCNGQWKDNYSFLSRHRVEYKNTTKSIFRALRNCDFLNIDKS